MSDVSKSDLEAFAAARWKQVAGETKIPPEMRDRLLSLLAGEGTSISKAAEALGVKPWPVRKWLERLRSEGLVRIEGEKRGQRWRLNDAPESGDGS
jgi:transposase